MAMKPAIRAALVADATFAAQVTDARLFGAGAIQSAPDLAQGKFAVLRYDPSIARIADVSTTNFFLYVYDRLGGPYTAIDATIKRAKEVLGALGQVNHGDGWIICIKYLGKSGELVD